MTDTENDKLSRYPKTKTEKQPKGTEVETRAKLSGKNYPGFIPWNKDFHEKKKKKCVDIVRGMHYIFLTTCVLTQEYHSLTNQRLNFHSCLSTETCASGHPPSTPPYRATIFPCWSRCCKKIGHVYLGKHGGGPRKRAESCWQRSFWDIRN